MTCFWSRPDLPRREQIDAKSKSRQTFQDRLRKPTMILDKQNAHSTSLT
jgi:hypothetical protein